MSSTFSISSRKTVAVLTVAVISAVSASQPATGQTARVQFINASVYEEADTIDFYVNGVLKLDDLAYGSGTPYTDYPAGDPLEREGELSFEFFVMSGAREQSTIAGLVDYVLFNNMPHTSVLFTGTRRMDRNQESEPRRFLGTRYLTPDIGLPTPDTI